MEQRWVEKKDERRAGMKATMKERQTGLKMGLTRVEMRDRKWKDERRG